MNIRYPIYEGVYRILTSENDRESPYLSVFHIVLKLTKAVILQT